MSFGVAPVSEKRHRNTDVRNNGGVVHPTISSFKAGELRVRRIRAGLTQLAAAEQLGVSAWTVRQWEAGNHTPRAERLPELARVLGCEPSDLVEAPTNLADYRTLAGLTQSDLAAQLGVSRMTVAQWESGLMPIAPRHHERLAAALGITVETLPSTG